ncbi:SulP family inorganic anion transporter [Echinicola salinicaeni]|uniref:SulP family inorganic anion transporter n=1 Tax=Echinicola salinicaeni TaxID=2762757 RepID=UPI0016487EAF|nr:SulP family inorganic anion transporter [Echinicola salinicaeni]
MKNKLNYYLSHLNKDFPAGLVVFLVALPLCLGIALASGAPLFSGLVTGIVAGLVVSILSGSQTAVSGPAAGLTVIVLNGIETLNSYEAFLVAVVLAGVIQLILGLIKAGVIGLYFPSSVIKGMLAAIGLILILKQIPHFLGVDSDFFGNEGFRQPDGKNTFTELFYSIFHIGLGPMIIGIVSLGIMILWEKPFIKKIKGLTFLPGALLAVLIGIFINIIFKTTMPSLEVVQSHLVNIPMIESFSGLAEQLTFPDFSILGNIDLYIVAFTIGIVASLETLLCIEASDKLDRHKRRTPNNRELRAQGIGNIIAGLIGGLPMTAVIVRSSANVESGGETKVSAFIHGLLLCLCVALIPNILNMIPLSALAAVLLMVGYKLTKLDLYKRMYIMGIDQFIPFLVTVVAILLTDLLIGIGIGMSVAIYFILKANIKTPYFLEVDKNADQHSFKLALSEHMSFLNKASMAKTLEKIPENAILEIDGQKSVYIDMDVLETIYNFRETAKDKNIQLILKNLPEEVT